MIGRRVVRRYASALFGAASKAGVVDLVESDLGLISYTVEASPRLMQAIASPLVPTKAKREVLQTIFSGKIQEITLNYLFLLVDKRREEAVLKTEEEFVILANEARGIVNAEVITAIEMTKEQQAALAAKLSKLTGKSVNLQVTVDSWIKGGVIVRIGDTVIDGSIRGQLAALKETLLS
ncbi:MAG: ATP synthase F1 subunit delta [Armatimonadetes bacterium]|nr:ATP synthase F1 subunit delta [Armatimonadota bacterium]